MMDRPFPGPLFSLFPSRLFSAAPRVCVYIHVMFGISLFFQCSQCRSFTRPVNTVFSFRILFFFRFSFPCQRYSAHRTGANDYYWRSGQPAFDSANRRSIYNLIGDARLHFSHCNCIGKRANEKQIHRRCGFGFNCLFTRDLISRANFKKFWFLFFSKTLLWVDC